MHFFLLLRNSGANYVITPTNIKLKWDHQQGWPTIQSYFHQTRPKHYGNIARGGFMQDTFTCSLTIEIWYPIKTKR